MEGAKQQTCPRVLSFWRLCRMIGFSGEEFLETINNLNSSKYSKIYEENVQQLSKQYGYMTNDYKQNFLMWYCENIAPQITADLIEETNKKITQDIQLLLSK
jgi:hypothetical protein